MLREPRRRQRNLLATAVRRRPSLRQGYGVAGTPVATAAASQFSVDAVASYWNRLMCSAHVDLSVFPSMSLITQLHSPKPSHRFPWA